MARLVVSMREVTPENFEETVLKSDIPVLVDFWATWCGPCKMIMPTLNQLEPEFEGRIALVKANADECQDLMAKYGVRSVPTLMIFKNGEPVDQMMGAQARSQIQALILKHAAS